MEFTVSDDRVNSSPAANPVFGPEVFRLYLGAAPIDMRLGMDGVLARVIDRFGHAQPHCAYAFVNVRCNRMKLLIHDGLGFWLALRRLHSGRFYWIDQPLPHAVSLSPAQWHALARGLPWSRIDQVIGAH
jgi:transposase